MLKSNMFCPERNQVLFILSMLLIISFVIFFCEGSCQAAGTADLAVSSVEGPDTSAMGGRVTVKDTVTNNGNAAAKAFYVTYYLSDDEDIATDDNKLGQRSVTGLSAGASSIGNTTLNLPSGLSDGTYYLGVIADSGESVVESAEDNNTGWDKDGIVLTAPFRDLTVSSIEGPASGGAGSTIVVSDTVANNGNASSRSCALKFYLSADNTVLPSDILLGQRNVPSLAAGASNNVNTTLTIPTTVTPGDYYVGAIADANNGVIESNENNNTGCDTGVITISVPDLEMTSIIGPDTAKTGTSIAITAVVTNTSSVASKGCMARYYLSTDTSITSGDILLSQRSIKALAAGAADSISTTLIIPNTMEGGTYYLGAVVDATSLIIESNEANNTICATDPITIEAPYKDLVVSSVEVPASAATGSRVTIKDTVSNNGNGVTGAFSVTYYLSSDEVITTGDVKLGLRSLPGGLAPGGSSTGNMALNVPASLAEGSYYLGVIVDSEGSVVESNETNNTGWDEDPIAVAAPYRDLTISAIDGPDDGGAGFSIVVSNTVINNGNAAVGASAEKFYLSTDTTITTADILLGQRSIPSLAAGVSSNVNTTLTIPGTVSPGDYYLGAIADTGNCIAESNENNNTGYDADVITVNIPDLAMTSVNGPTSGKSGTSITITDVVTNNSIVASKACVLRYYFSSDDTITTTDQPVGQRSVPALAAGGVSNGSIKLTLAANLPGGTYYLGAVADAYKQINESSEINNTACDPDPIVIVGPYKDLVVTMVEGPTAAVSGAKVTVKDTVRNKGNGATGTFKVAYYLSDDQDITSTDTRLGQRIVQEGLTGGTSSTGSTALTLPANLAGGSYYLGVIADSGAEVAESDETNNTGRDTNGIAVTTPNRDLVVSAIDAPASGKTGSSITVSNRVTNNGDTATTSCTMRFYASNDEDITTADTLLGQRTVPSLAAGASNSTITTLNLPSGLSAGRYYIGAIVDVLDIVLETDETNNTAYDTSAISVDLPDLIISSVNVPLTAAIGSNIDVTCQIKNTGTIGANGFYIEYCLMSSDVVPVETALGTSYVDTELAAAATANISKSLIIPDTLTAGTYSMRFEIDSSGVVSEGNENNNEATKGIEIQE